MTVLADFQQFVADEQAASLYTTWKKSNPADAVRWAALEPKVTTATASGLTLPTMTTAFGRGLVDAAKEYLDTLPTPTPPPTPGPPATPPMPQGPFTQETQAQWYRNIATPTAINKLQINGAGITPGQTGYGYGLGIMSYWPPTLPPLPVQPWAVTDILAQNVGVTPPQSAGTAEAGIWLGALTTLLRGLGDGSWEGIWTGCTVGNSKLTDFIAAKLDSSGNPTLPTGAASALYMEHVSYGLTLLNGLLMSDGHGGNSEWWYPDATYAAYVASILGANWAGVGKAGSWGNTFDGVSFYCAKGQPGMFEDAGTFGNHYTRCYWWGPGDGLGLPNNRLGPLSVVDPSCVFANEGASIYYHSNAIGVAGKPAQPGRPLHPHTLRRPPQSERFPEIFALGH